MVIEFIKFHPEPVQQHETEFQIKMSTYISSFLLNSYHSIIEKGETDLKVYSTNQYKLDSLLNEIRYPYFSNTKTILIRKQFCHQFSETKIQVKFSNFFFIFLCLSTYNAILKMSRCRCKMQMTENINRDLRHFKHYWK